MEEVKRYKRGLWSGEEDRILMDYVRMHGKGRWNRIAKMTGLKRCGKSCRLRWINYLSPTIKHGDFSEEEDDLIIRLHNLLGNRWSLIAGRVPGRTDNQVKNHWNTHLSKKLGIRKLRTKLVGASSSRARTLSVSANNIAENIDKVAMNTSLKPPCNDNIKGIEDQNMVGDDSENKLIGLFEEEEHMVNECYDSPFWYSNLNATTPSVMEFLDQHSSDSLWQYGL